MISEIEKMIGVGLVWGSTNSLMRRGALLWEQKLQSAPPASRDHRGVIGQVLKWLDLLLLWQYSVPFLVNLSASAAFFYILGDSPISVAVPVTNATTFAATAASAILLGEEMRIGPALLGIALIVLGVWICITDCIQAKHLSVHHVSTTDQLADIFTKALSTARLQLLRTKLMVTPPIILRDGEKNCSTKHARQTA